ncbi:MAG: hypothetical protein JWP37_3009 [Mucilaginibacter sp.]|nr:hypothetical protein [Mucilaginibacter sp.]
MELEKMKTLWEEMSIEIDKQKKLTDSLIIKMTQTNYRNKVNKILIPEAIGALVCFAGIMFIVINFQKLNTWYLLVCGIVAALILFILPILSIKAIRYMRSINISANNYKQSLLEYSKGKLQFVFVQKLSFYLGAILMLVVLPVMGRIIGGMDFFRETRIWYWYAIGFPFFYWFAKWVFKSYDKSTTDAENILKELDA